MRGILQRKQGFHKGPGSAVVKDGVVFQVADLDHALGVQPVH